MKTLILLCVTSLVTAGCATCERHPVACGIGGAFLVTSVSLSIGGHGDNRGEAFVARCGGNPGLCGVK